MLYELCGMQMFEWFWIVEKLCKQNVNKRFFFRIPFKLEANSIGHFSCDLP